LVTFSMGAPQAQRSLAGAPFREWSFPDGTPWTSFYRVEAGYLLRFPGLADFLVSADGQEVACVPAPGAAAATTQHLYLNQVLPLAWGKQGKLVFHASAVEVEGGAVAFLAESGRGKSTLAASFATCGYSFLTDEGLVLEKTADGYQVMPSHPSLRLWEDSQLAVVSPGAAVAPPLSFTTKARLLAGGELRFCAQPRPLRRAYFLGDRAAPAVQLEPLGAAEAMVEWVKSSFLLDPEEKVRLASHFAQVADLAAQPLGFRLDFPRRFDELPAVRAAIVKHAAGRGG
jgi:hypothetical protein